MIKVTSIKLDPNTKTADVSLFSDTKAEVLPNAEIEGFPAEYIIAAGSTVITASGELAFMKSDGAWNWV